jgi:hypothetical protein
VAGRSQNLTPWKPGQSGNPGGRPKSAPISDLLHVLLLNPCENDPLKRIHAEVIAQALIDRACGGDVKAAREIADRVEGRVPASVTVVTEECQTCRGAREEQSQQWHEFLRGLSDDNLARLSESLEASLEPTSGH